MTFKLSTIMLCLNDISSNTIQINLGFLLAALAATEAYITFNIKTNKQEPETTIVNTTLVNKRSAILLFDN